MKLRPYQDHCVHRVVEEWKTKTSTLVVAPTGSGKTCIFAGLIQKMQPARALVLAHRRELIYQARDKIELVAGVPCEVEMANHSARSNLFHASPVVVASVQTLNTGPQFEKRIRKFRPEHFGLVIIDEAHHSTAGTYRFIIDWFRRNPALRIVGVTATPDRADQEALGQIFESVAFNYEILDAIRDGWLVDVCQHYVPVSKLDYSHIRTTAGDLNGGDLAKVMEQEGNVQGVCHPTLEIIYGHSPHMLDAVATNDWSQALGMGNRKPRRTIVFAASVAQAEMCSNIFNRAVPGLSEWVCGKTNSDKRKAILDRFMAGDTAVVCNCGVLTEGFDNPHVEVVVMARPTKSRSLYSQMLGRATRPLPGIVDQFEQAPDRVQAIASSPKPYCRVVDFVGNSGRHKLISSADILGGKVTDAAISKAIKIALEKAKPVRMARTLERAEVELEKERIAAAERSRRLEESLKARLLAKVEFTTLKVNPFSVLDMAPMNTSGWKTKTPLTLKQRQFLLRQGVDPDRIKPEEANRLLQEIFRRLRGRLCSLRQASAIKKYRPSTNTNNLTREQASRLLDQIKTSGWNVSNT